MDAEPKLSESPTPPNTLVPPSNQGTGTKALQSKNVMPWGPWAAVLYSAAVYIVSQYAALLLLLVYPLARGWSHLKGDDWMSNSVVAQFLFVLFAEAVTFGAIWWILRLRKAGLRSIGWGRFRSSHVAFAVIAYVVYVICYAVLLSVAKHAFPSLNVNQKQDLGFQNVSGAFGLTLTFLSLVVLPPLVEETMFRGFIFTGLRNKLKWGWAALITSVLFASAHLEFGRLVWVAALDTFSLSMVLCFLRQKTDNLWPGILLHALKNGIAFLSLFILHLS